MTTATDERLQRYAEVIVRVGANVQPGQDVYVSADVAHLEMARAVAEQAYVAGAERVIVDYNDAHVRLAALHHAPLEGLSKVLDWELAKTRGLDDTGVAIITLTGNAEPHLFAHVDPRRLAAMPVELAMAKRDVGHGRLPRLDGRGSTRTRAGPSRSSASPTSSGSGRR